MDIKQFYFKASQVKEVENCFQLENCTSSLCGDVHTELELSK